MNHQNTTIEELSNYLERFVMTGAIPRQTDEDDFASPPSPVSPHSSTSYIGGEPLFDTPPLTGYTKQQGPSLVQMFQTIMPLMGVQQPQQPTQAEKCLSQKQIKNIHHAFDIVDLDSNTSNKFVRVLSERGESMDNFTAHQIITLFELLFPEIEETVARRLGHILYHSL